MRGFIKSHSVPSALFKSLFLGSKGMSNNTSSRMCLVLVHKVSLLWLPNVFSLFFLTLTAMAKKKQQ